MKKGLILEGGAMRGLFSAGIFDTMLTEGVEFDGMIGVSAGADDVLSVSDNFSIGFVYRF